VTGDCRRGQRGQFGGARPVAAVVGGGGCHAGLSGDQGGGPAVGDLVADRRRQAWQHFVGGCGQLQYSVSGQHDCLPFRLVITTPGSSRVLPGAA
jgi:hypothetical protein